MPVRREPSRNPAIHPSCTLVPEEMLPLFCPMRNAGVKSGMVPEPPDAISGASCTIRPPRPIAIEPQQGDAADAGSVCQAEGRPVPAGGVELGNMVAGVMPQAVSSADRGVGTEG